MLILASLSPRRSELLQAAGLPFKVRACEVDESIEEGETPHAYVQRLAKKKALAIEIHPDEVILGADTTVAVADEILGKPANDEEARRMLTKLSARRHEVYTGVCLRSSRQITTRVACTGVWFEKLTKAEIDDYVRSGEPLDKAGAYAIQGLASKFIPRIAGSYSNVVGLPVDLVYRMLKEHTSAGSVFDDPFARHVARPRNPELKLEQ
jgi:septum formation protein